MSNQWFLLWMGLIDWLIFSASLFTIAGKLGWNRKWKAWILYP